MGWSFSCQPVVIQLKTSNPSTSYAFDVCLNLNYILPLLINIAIHQLGIDIALIYYKMC